MWGASHDGEGSSIRGARGRESGGRREGGTPRSGSLLEAREREVGRALISSSLAVIIDTVCCVYCMLLLWPP